MKLQIALITTLFAAISFASVPCGSVPSLTGKVIMSVDGGDKTDVSVFFLDYNSRKKAYVGKMNLAYSEPGDDYYKVEIQLNGFIADDKAHCQIVTTYNAIDGQTGELLETYDDTEEIYAVDGNKIHTSQTYVSGVVTKYTYEVLN